MRKLLTFAAAAALSATMVFGAAAAPSNVYASSPTHNYAKTANIASRSAEGGHWETSGSDYIYKYSDGMWANSCWLELDCGDTKEWFHFNGKSVMDIGWIQDGGNWYYLNPTEDGVLGAMVTGWQCLDGTWYYFGEEGNFKGILYQNTTTPDGFMVGLDGAWIE